MSHVIGTPGAPCPGPRRFPSGVRVVIPPAVPYPLGHPVRTVNGVLPDEHGDIRVADATATERGLMSAEDKAKLDGVEAGAEVNAIATVKVDGAALVPDEGRAVDIDLTGKADKATTLAGYGITDAKIANGVIILGDSSITPLTSHQSLAAYVNGGSYDPASKKILLKHDSSTIAEIDATAFVKDGMVSSVEIDDGNLVITFNTDAGQEPIEIPLTDIFDPDDYYDKTAADMLLSGKADKVANAVSGHLAALDANGNLTDSGKAAGDFLPKTGGTVNGDLEVVYGDTGFTVKDASGNYLWIKHDTVAGDFWYVDYSVANVGSGSLRLPYDSIIPAGIQSLAGYFNDSTVYPYNSLCAGTDGGLYRCVNPNGHTGAWVAADFALVTVEDVLAELRTGKADKSTTYTRAEVDAIVQALKTGSREIVETLPASGQPMVIYMVPKSASQTNNAYDEYIWTAAGAWEKIGDTEIDLSGYYTKTVANETFVAKEQGKGLSTNDYTTAEKQKLAGIAAGADVTPTPIAPSANPDDAGNAADAYATGMALSAKAEARSGTQGNIAVYAEFPTLLEDSGYAPSDFATSADIPSPSSTTPSMDGTAAVGESTDYARADHVHPSDTGKADASSLATAFSSDSTVQYAVGSHCTYNGKLYKCTTATTGGTWVAGNWAEDTMTDPDAVLDITAQNQLRVVAKDGTLLWAQGYDLASTSSATLACDAVNNFTFTDGATSQAFALPAAPTGKVGDFALDIDNSANTGAATMTLTGLDTTFSVVVPKGKSLNDMLAIAAGELARFYISLSTFRVNNLPTWHIVKQVVENGGATA